MPRDTVRDGDTKAWLDKASQDLRRVEILLAALPADVEGALYHSQQAAEKALKGLLTWHDLGFRRIHDLDELGKICLAADPSLSSLMIRAAPLTAYASLFRYPGAQYIPIQLPIDFQIVAIRNGHVIRVRPVPR